MKNIHHKVGTFRDENILAVEKILKYTFKNKKLLELALTHPSKSEQNYEILEFRGDAVLNLVITDAVANEFKSISNEGKLAKLKAYLVSSEVIAKISQELNLTQYIFMSYGEAATGGRSKSNIAENVMEAILAAIYLDSNLEVVKDFIIKLWNPFILNSIHMSESFDPKTQLQELIFDKYKVYPQYSLIEMRQLQFSHNFKVEVKCGPYAAIGNGNNKKEAEKDAAKIMLKTLKNNSIF